MFFQSSGKLRDHLGLPLRLGPGVVHYHAACIIHMRCPQMPNPVLTALGCSVHHTLVLSYCSPCALVFLVWKSHSCD